MPRVGRESISRSLAARGHYENWATEDEAAALSGMTSDQFRKLQYILEARGFPKRHPWNKRRFIKAINAFWERDRAERWPWMPPDDDDDGPGVENWSKPARSR